MTDKKTPVSFAAPFTAPRVDPKPKPDPLQAAVKQIEAWQHGDVLKITGVDGDLFNQLNSMFREDKKDRGYKFEHDQSGVQTLTVTRK